MRVDELAEKLKTVFAGSVAAGDWKPLAQKVMDMMELTQRKVLEVRIETGTMASIILESDGVL